MPGKTTAYVHDSSKRCSSTLGRRKHLWCLDTLDALVVLLSWGSSISRYTQSIIIAKTINKPNQHCEVHSPNTHDHAFRPCVRRAKARSGVCVSACGPRCSRGLQMPRDREPSLTTVGQGAGGTGLLSWDNSTKTSSPNKHLSIPLHQFSSIDLVTPPSTCLPTTATKSSSSRTRFWTSRAKGEILLPVPEKRKNRRELTGDLVILRDEALLNQYGLKANDAILAEKNHLTLYDELIKNRNAKLLAGGAAQNSARGAQVCRS